MAPLTDIKDMAARYVEEITVLYPTGPYHLYGWSLGGVIAFEMAQQLQAANSEVGLLALADSAFPHPNEKQEEPTDETILMHLLAEVEPAFFQEVQNISPENRQIFLRNRLASGSNSMDSADVERLVPVYKANLTAISEYCPSPLEKNIVLLSAQERIEGQVDSLESGWRGLVRQMGHYTASGNHFTMHRQPSVQEVAKIIDELLP